MSGNGMAFFSNFIIQTPHHEDDRQPPISLNPILPTCAPQDFHGIASFLGKRSMSFSGIEMGEEANGEEDLSDDGSQIGEKKRRLNIEQVKTLEKNFELGNKLEPERKLQLARALGLQPRQIAIWFQNRRARWKTKQLEKDYDLLKRHFDAIKAENDSLQAHNQKLQAQIMTLKSREPNESINLNIKETTEGSCSNRSENSSDIKLDKSRTQAIDSPLSSQQASSRQLFPSNITSRPPSGVTQLFQTSSRSQNHHELQCQKIITNNNNNNNIENMVKEESLSNMFCSIDDQSAFWPWLEHQHFN